MGKDDKNLIICGVNAVQEKLKSAPDEILEFLLASERDRGRLESMLADAGDTDAGRKAVRVVGDRHLAALTGGAAHQGVAAVVAPYAYQSLDVLPAPAAGEPGRILVLDGITDPHNFGALLRSAEGAGISHVVIGKDRAVGVTPVVAKTSAGAVNHLIIHRVTNLSRALEQIKEKGYWVAGLDPAAPETIYDRQYPESLAVVLGSEGSGMRPLIRRQCDFLASIPMLGSVASLNVSVAGGVFFYELARQARSRSEKS